MDDPQFRQLLDFFGLSWDGYRKVRIGVKRRVSRHMLQVGFRGVDELLLAMETERELRKQVENLMTVSISRFFRDRGLWRALENHVLPMVLERKDPIIKVWSVGCACGEEPYSFKILWETMKGDFERLPDLELWATDMNPVYLDKARAGVYPASSLKELPGEIRSRYFQRADESGSAIAHNLKEGILWKVHNLLSNDPPRMGFQIIFLRNNLLTYYKKELQEPAFVRVLDSLTPGGFLIIGSHEKLPVECQALAPFALHPNIFQKI
jgi:chemotaxis methyl-accepting protein methylase